MLQGVKVGESCPARAPKLDARAGSRSSTGKSPAPVGRRAEEDRMRLLNAVIGTIALASLGAVNKGGPAPRGGGGGGGGGAVGAVTVGPGIQFVSGHNGSQNPA